MFELVNIGAGLSIGLAALWVAIGQGFLVFKAMQVMGKNPKMSNFYLTTTILGIALVESAAIYGLIIAFQIMTAGFTEPLAAIWVWLAIGLTGLWAGIGEWLMVSWALEAMNKDPDNRNKIMTYMILFLALIESVAIYGLILSFQILGDIEIQSFVAIGSGLALGFAGLWVGIGEWIVAQKSLHVMAKKPEAAGFILAMTILAIALVETAAIYGFIIALQILTTTFVSPMVAVWAGLAIGLAWLGVGVWEWILAASAMEAMIVSESRRGKMLTYMILCIALVESAAIYGLIVAMQLISNDEISGFAAIGSGLAIWLSGLGVGIGEWLMADKAINVIAKRPTLTNFFLTITILGIALVESAAIYGLVVAFSIMSTTTIIGLSALGAGIAIWFAALGAWVWEGLLVGSSMEAMSRNPANKSKYLTFMILFLALVEVLAIYGLIIAFKILG